MYLIHVGFTRNHDSHCVTPEVRRVFLIHLVQGQRNRRLAVLSIGYCQLCSPGDNKVSRQEVIRIIGNVEVDGLLNVE